MCPLHHPHHRLHRLSAAFFPPYVYVSARIYKLYLIFHREGCKLFVLTGPHGPQCQMPCSLCWEQTGRQPPPSLSLSCLLSVHHTRHRTRLTEHQGLDRNFGEGVQVGSQGEAWVAKGCRRGSGWGRFGGKKVSGQRGQQVDLSERGKEGTRWWGGLLATLKRWNFDELVCVLPSFTNELLPK